MPLSGDAKTAYQREYMRRRRAGAGPKGAAPTRKPAGSNAGLTQIKLAAKLEPFLQGLYEQGKQSKAAMSPPSVLRYAVLLERTLVEAGIIPPSKRTEKTARDHARRLAKL